MDPYLELVIALVMACVLAALIQRMARNSQKTPTGNPTTSTAEYNRAQAYEQVLNRLSTHNRRNLARLVLALANQGKIHYGSPEMIAAVAHTYPVINGMQNTVHARMGIVFSARRMVDKMTSRETLKPPTAREYNKMVKLLSTDKDFLVVAVRHSHTLRAVLQFLQSPECDIEKFMHSWLALTLRDVEILEAINHEIFRPVPPPS